MSTKVWAASILTAMFLFAGLAVGVSNSAILPNLRSQHSRPSVHVPEQVVAVVADGKTFHDPSCKYIHGKPMMISARDAVATGYTPCIRCMRKAFR